MKKILNAVKRAWEILVGVYLWDVFIRKTEFVRRTVIRLEGVLPKSEISTSAFIAVFLVAIPVSFMAFKKAVKVKQGTPEQIMLLMVAYLSGGAVMLFMAYVVMAIL